MTIKKLKAIINEFDDDDRIVLCTKNGAISLDNEILFLEKIIPLNKNDDPKLVVAQTRNEIDVRLELEARIDYYQEENWREIDMIEDLFNLGFRLDDFLYEPSRYEMMKTKLERSTAEAELSDIADVLAEKILKLYDIQIPVMDISNVVEKIGGKIEESDNVHSQKDCYIRTGGNQFSIIIPKNSRVETRNLEVAKEIGHLFIHLKYAGEPQITEPYKYYRFSDPLSDYQAKQFALAFLMPKKEYMQAIQNHMSGSCVNTSEIAQYFGVDVTAATERGHILEMFK